MQPTMKLRWVIRNTGGKTIDSWLGKIVTEDYYEKVLQQWWEGWPNGTLLNDRNAKPPGEWRDIPIEEENERP